MNEHSIQYRFSSEIKRRVCQIFLLLITALIPASPVFAQLTFPPGSACPAFTLTLSAEGGNQVSREFFDKNHQLVRTLSAGRGSILTFTNVEADTSLTLKTGGSVTRTKRNPDGTFTTTSTGHNVFLFAMTDTPPGPATTLYLGKVVYTFNEESGLLIVLESSGKQVDICALLAA